MAESQKGASSTSESKKKSSSLDDDIGKDFLSSWKLTSSEKDALDFTSELPPRVKKAAFDFNKIDDFEFGGEFDKMPSFKIDMSDLDFSSPRRETEKSKERSGKLSILEEDGKQDAFSFSFDFNELESFGLDSNLLKDETKTTTDNRGPDNTVRNDNSAGSRSNSTTCTDLKGKDLENLSKLDEVSSSDTEQMTACKELVVVNHGSTHTANIEFSEEPHAVDKEKNAAPVNKNSGSKEPVAVDKQITAPQVNKNSGNKNEGKNEQLKRQGSETMFSEKDVQGFSVQSGNMVVVETLPEFQPAIQLLGSLNPTKSGIEQDQSAKSLSSPDSRGSSSVNTFNLKCPSTASLRESPGVENKSQARQGGQNDMTTRRINHQKLDEKYIGDAPTMAISNAQGCVMKSTENSCSSSPITVLSSLHREPRFQMLTPLNVKGSALQSKPLDNSEATESLQSSASNPKQIHAISSMKMERLHLSPTNEKREATRKVEQALQKGVSTNSFDGELTKPGMPVPERERNKKDGFTLSLLKQTTCSSPLSTVTKLGGLAHKKLLKISSAEKDVKSDKMCEYSSLKISRLKESKNDIAITTDKKEPNIIRISDMNMEIDSRTSIAANNGITVKCALQSPPLKRKSLEGPYADSATLNPSKRISESPKGRNLTEASPKTNPRLVTDKNQVQRTENKEGIPNDVSFDPQISSEVVTSEASMMDTDIPLVLENYGNVEKAEACAKELDDICNMLRKKHEEAKELLVRAVVNNNSLLMLNHPMYEEKIRSLQRFSTALLSKDYES